MERSLDAVIFDVDGTLIDTVDFHAEAWERTFRHFGHDVPFAEVRSQIGKGGDQLMPVFLPEDEVERRGEEIESHRVELFRRDYLPRVRAFPAVPELFRAIRADGLRVALASSCKEDELAAYLDILGVADLIDARTTSDDADRSKPHPDIFEAALARLGVSPDRAVVVGDTPYDAQAAGRAGLGAVGVLCGGFPEQDLRGAGCVEIHRDPEDILRRYDGSVIAGRGAAARRTT